MRAAEAVNSVKQKLEKNGIDNPMLDAQLIVGSCTGMSRVQILTYPDKILEENQICKINEMCLKRIKRMPMQYILGVCEFMGLDFNVNEHTLIPRGDTEILVENAIEIIKDKDYKLALDIGTGSGAIAVSVSKYTEAEVFAVDISTEAIEMAKKNAMNNNVSVKFINSNLFENVEGKFDIILSNPPYIEKEVIKTLESDVKDYEPILALDGGVDGLDFYRRIIKDCHKHINDQGSVIFEIGYNQGEAVSKLLIDKGFQNVEVKKDLAGLDRVVIGFNLC